MKHFKLFWPLFLPGVFALSGCRLEALKISEIKSSPPGREYTVTGYFSSDPIPMIVLDNQVLNVNTPMPPNGYLLLEGVALDSAKMPSAKTYKALVTARGKVAKSADTSIVENVLDVESFNVNSIASNSGPNPEIINFCVKDPSLCIDGPANLKKFALLFSGGVSPADAKNRYWNDLTFLYRTLISQYGYTKDNIVVVYKDKLPAQYSNGTPSTDMEVDYAATPNGLDDAILDLQTRMGTDLSATLLVFTTNHGGGFRSASNTMKGGAADNTSSPDESETSHITDETIYYYNAPEVYIIDDNWAAKINSLVNVAGGHRRLITINQPCFSGGLIRDLSGTNRAHLAASSETEYSYSLDDGSFDEFTYHFVSALHGSYPDTHQTITLPVLTSTGRVSVLQAFLYAKNHELSPATFYLEDNGDGIGVSTPISSSSATSVDGNFSAGISL